MLNTKQIAELNKKLTIALRPIYKYLSPQFIHLIFSDLINGEKSIEIIKILPKDSRPLLSINSLLKFTQSYPQSSNKKKNNEVAEKDFIFIRNKRLKKELKFVETKLKNLNKFDIKKYFLSDIKLIIDSEYIIKNTTTAFSTIQSIFKIYEVGLFNNDGDHSLIEFLAESPPSKLEIFLNYLMEISVLNHEYFDTEVLLKYGANPNHRIKHNNRPVLFHAVTKGWSDIVELLLDHKANQNFIHGFNSPLTMAISTKQTKIINSLIDSANENIVNEPNTLGLSPLYLTMMKYKYPMPILEKLLTKGADPFKEHAINHPAIFRKYISAIEHAVSESCNEAINLFLKRREIDEHTSKIMKKCYNIAVKNQQFETAEMLLNRLPLLKANPTPKHQSEDSKQLEPPTKISNNNLTFSANKKNSKPTEAPPLEESTRYNKKRKRARKVSDNLRRL